MAESGRLRVTRTRCGPRLKMALSGPDLPGVAREGPWFSGEHACGRHSVIQLTSHATGADDLWPLGSVTGVERVRAGASDPGGPHSPPLGPLSSPGRL